jgi:hypothetical protein
MYCGAMPAMYLLGCLHFFLGYWAYKYLFINYWKKTYGFNESLPIDTLYVLFIGIIVHLIMNLFMYTNKRLMTPQKYTTDDHYRPMS